MQPVFFPIPIDKYYTISNSKEFYHTIGWADGEYKVVGARILGISYPSYLRMARDWFKAKIIDIDKKYFNLIFETYEDCEIFCKLLNDRWEELFK